MLAQLNGGHSDQFFECSCDFFVFLIQWTGVGRNPGKHWTEGWVGPWGGLDFFLKRFIGISAIGAAIQFTELSRLLTK